jgi:hypothetical protein
MNKLFACFALAFVAPIFGSLHAQEGPPPDEYEPPPPVGLDVDYFAPPKQKIYVGFRVLGGPRVSFSGSGTIPSGVNPGFDSTTTVRSYSDGNVSPNTRTDVTTGAAITDGRTDTWNYDSASQLGADGTSVNLDAYSATIIGNNPHTGRAGSGTGLELTFERDFGWHWGKVQFDIIGGLGMNKITYSRTSNILAAVTTQTDNYSTFGPILDANGDPVLDADNNPTYSATPTAPPAAPYSAPSTTTDTAGNSVANTTLLNSEPNPNSSSTSTVTNDTEVTDQWNITGAYFTLRAGAQVTVPITSKFSASVSGGPALVYVGTTFSVNQTINPPTGNPVTSTVSDEYNTVLPAYFADADVEYSLTDTTGLYLGAVFQSTTGYNQAINSPDGNYTTRINFGNQEGVRGGISFKF